MRHKHVFWLAGYFLLIAVALGLVAVKVIYVDPFFHFHKPRTKEYYYSLDNQRSQNDGITKHFDYTGLITGTSMTENMKTSDAESLWGGSFIKVPFMGASYKEINDNIHVALRRNPNLRVVIRSLDMSKFLYEKDKMRYDLGTYPFYLYDDNIFNDVEYVFNRSVVFSRVYPMMKANDEPGFKTGITSFDDYSNWAKKSKYGKSVLFPEGIKMKDAKAPVHLSEKEAAIVKESIEQNIVYPAKDYPDVTFYYFFTPYSAKWWMAILEDGTIYKQIEAERIIIEELLKYPNIKLFSFNCRHDLTTDLNNYRDYIHYGEWINSLMLRCMKEDRYLLTAENYNAYLEEELQFYTTYDYTLMNDQPDYDNDFYAAFLVAEETYGLVGQDIDLTDKHIKLHKAELVNDQYEGKPGILCTGSLKRDLKNNEITIGDYLRDTEFIGFKLTIKDITPYKYISFYGKKLKNSGQPTVYVYNKEGAVVAQSTDNYRKINDEWKQYVIDVTDLKGKVYIIFNGGYVDSSGSQQSKYVFSDVKIY